MGKRTHHSVGYRVFDIYKSLDRSALLTILSVEAATFLLILIFGHGIKILPITLMLMLFTAAICIITFYLGGNKAIVLFTIALVNLGFLAQFVQESDEINIKKYVLFSALALACLITAFACYLKQEFLLEKLRFLLKELNLEFLLKGSNVVILMVAVQYIICVVMWLLGKGTEAKISLHGINFFEVVKVLYVFVCAALLLDNTSDKKVFGDRIHRSTALLLAHTLVLTLFFGICSELGTLLVIWIVYMIMGWIFGKDKKFYAKIIAAFIGSFLLFWVVSDRILYPRLSNIHVPSIAAKLISRFGVALYPEKAMSTDGYQGTMGLLAIALGGWTGNTSERYRLSANEFSLPRANDDFLFANIVQTCGVLFGAMIIVFFLGLFRAGFHVAQECEEDYSQRVAVGITVMIFAEALIHIGYNLAILPITGIPLYFCSSGFAALVTGMVLIGVLLAISVRSRGTE